MLHARCCVVSIEDISVSVPGVLYPPAQLYTMYLGVALNLAYPLMTFCTASSISASVTAFLLARIAYIPASSSSEHTEGV